MPPHRDPILQKCPSNATENVGRLMVILSMFMGIHGSSCRGPDPALGAPDLANQHSGWTHPAVCCHVRLVRSKKRHLYQHLYHRYSTIYYGKTANHPPTQPRFTQESLGAPHWGASSAAVRTYGIENFPPKRHCWDFFHMFQISYPTV